MAFGVRSVSSVFFCISISWQVLSVTAVALDLRRSFLQGFPAVLPPWMDDPTLDVFLLGRSQPGPVHRLEGEPQASPKPEPVHVAAAELATRTSQRPPNIVFILSDDLGYGDYSISPGAEALPIPTPNIQRLANGGAKFVRGYAGPVCAPSRCTLMTGRHMGRCTVRGNDGSYTPILDSDVTVAEVLRKTHTTGIVGKWGLGDFGTDGYPLKQGFDYFVGQDSQVACHDWFPVTIRNNSEPFQPLNDRAKLGAACLEFGSQCTWINNLVRDEAVGFIQRNAHGPRPFFLYVSTTTPHDGILRNYAVDDGYPVPKMYSEAEFINKSWPAQLQHFAAAVWAQDVIVGAVLDELKNRQIEEDTVVFFAGDNGPDHHDFRVFNDAGPFRGKKRSLHEGGTRQTIAVQWKGHIAPGLVSDHLFAFWDFLPTAAELAGIPKNTWPVTEGISVAPILVGKVEEQPVHDYLYWELCYYETADGVLPQAYSKGWAQALRHDDSDGTEWKAIRVDRGPLLLWNLTADPSESVDVAASFAHVTKRIADMMEEAHVENLHWPSVGGPTGTAERCCDACYNPEAIDCEPQCKATRTQSSMTYAVDSRVAKNERQNLFEADELSGVWTEEGGKLFDLSIDGTLLTLHPHASACWQSGTGIVDVVEKVITASVHGDCSVHLKGVLSTSSEITRFDQDYKYHNVTYHVDWQKRGGGRWPRWSKRIGLEPHVPVAALSLGPANSQGMAQGQTGTDANHTKSFTVVDGADIFPFRQ